MENNAQLIAQCEAKAKQWLTSEFDEQTRNEVKGLMERLVLSMPSTKIWSLERAVCAVSWAQAATE